MPSLLARLLPSQVHFFFLVTITALFSALLMSHLTNANSQQGQADINRGESKQAGDQTIEPPHWLVGSYYNTQNGMTATLLLNNKGILPLEVRPTLYNMAGQELVLPPVIVEPSSHRFINLGDWANIGGESFARGSIRLFHYGKDLVLGAQIYLVDEEHSLSFEEKLAELGKFDSRRLEAVWAMPSRETEVEFAISNTSAAPVSVTARLTRTPHHTGEAQTFDLQPHQTRLLNLRQDFAAGEHAARSEAIALSLEHAGAKEALIARAFISERDRGYSNLAQFSNPTLGKSKALHGAGLRLGTIGGEGLVPVVAVRNTSNQTATLTARVPYTRTDGTDGVVILPRTRLKGNTVGLLDMSLVERESHAESIQVAGLEIDYDTPAGSLVVAAHTESQSGNQVFRLPLWDVLAQRSPTGGYPWRLEATSTTKAYIKNVTGRKQDYVAFLLYENGSRYMIGIKTVQPHQTIELDVRALRDNQVPDETGVTIPLNVSSGQLQWTLRRRNEPARNADELDRLALVGRSEQIDVIHGISSNYACQNCCGGTFLNGSIEPQNLQFETGDIVEFRAYEVGQTCYIYQAPNRVYPTNWSSTNPAVAIVGSNSGIVTMLGSGTAQIKASWAVERSYENYPCEGGGYIAVRIGNEKIASELQHEAASGKDIIPSIAQCGTCVGNWQPTNPVAGLTVSPTIAKLQYQSGSSYVDISGTLYVLRGTTVTFKAVPDPANATFPSNRPIWGGSSGASGTGTTKSVSFNTVSTSTSDFKTVSASSGNIRTASVLVFEVTGVLTPEDNFSGRSTMRFGIHEHLTLSSTITPSGITHAQVGGMQWVQSSGNGDLDATTNGTGTYEVSNTPGSAILKLTILDGPSKDSGLSKSITVVAPSGGNVQKFSSILHFQDWWSCGFKADIFITPTDVSFNNLFFVESEVGATAGGWLLFLSNQPHNAGAPLRIGFGNSVTGARVATNGDEIFSGQYRSLEHGGTYFGGTLNWAIPWNYSITGNAGTWNFMTTVNQTATSDSTGRCTISKDGSVVVTAALGDPNSSW